MSNWCNAVVFTFLGAAAGGAGCSSAFDDCKNSRTCSDSGAAEAGSPGESSDDEPSAGSDQGAGGSAEPAGAAGTESGAAGSAGEGGEGGAVDTIGPKIVSLTPKHGTKGIEKDAVITITFDEPMNEASVEEAFDSADLAGHVSYGWNDDGTVLTVTPSSPLVYYVGDDYVAAMTYTATITTAALDLAGNALQAQASTTFSTLRRVQRSIESHHIYTVWSNGIVQDELTSELGCMPVVGDTYHGFQVRAFYRFDLSELPVDLRELESAKLSVYFLNMAGDAYGSLGMLGVQHYYEPTYSSTSLLAPGLGALGTLADTPHVSGWHSLDVTAAVTDDITNQSAREQSSSYRLEFPSTTDLDQDSDFVALGCDPGATLELEYTRP